MDQRKPIIFLVFANSNVMPLPSLAEEYHRLQKILQPAQEKGICRVIEAPYAIVDNILNAFQRERIAIFHFAGHANAYHLLVQGANGQPAIAHADGLAAFLGQQTGLQLVFLNGCSTQPQVQGLLAAGVPVVIATSQAIKDDVATEFASRFYQFLADGDTIQIAFDKAQAAVQTVWGSETRNLYAVNVSDERMISRWPWDRYVRPGSEIALRWNLPDAADDPSFGLPPIPGKYYQNLPNNPFRGLTWFATEHAALFFGRGYQIRELYQQITAPQTPPLILLYGQSGVGKSSLLAAGLTPRLEESHTICYLRRNQKLGLLGTLQTVLQGHRDDMSMAETWACIEQSEHRPLLIILDQTEEAFTRPNLEQPHELVDFLTALEALSIATERWPRGKLILGFRKEWLAEIKRPVEEHKLPYTEVFLQRLDQRGVIEAIEGPTQLPELQAKYHLTIADKLPEVIADDLLTDPGSAVAPMLQILLTKLWERATKEDYAAPNLNRVLYQKLLTERPKRAENKSDKEVLGLQDIVDQQLAELKRRQPEVVTSGLALDVLTFHTTQLGTAEERTISELSQMYSHQMIRLPELLAECRDLYLLVDPIENRFDAEPASRLAHDTLAPLVRIRFDESDAPGQRARRILENRAVDWRGGKSGDRLDDFDLALVENGCDGMRARTVDEMRLIEASREESQQRHEATKRDQQELEDARKRDLEHVKARSRQKTWIISVLSTLLGLVLLWVGLRFYRDLYFRTSVWEPIAGDNFPTESVAYAITYTPVKSASSGYLYCIATWMVGVGCSSNGNTWNFYQQGFPTGASAPTAIGGLSGNMRGITALTFDVDNSEVMHAFVNDGHFYRSTNRGQTWAATVYTLPVETEVSTLAAERQLVVAVARRYSKGGDERLYVSQDGGQSWQLEVDSSDTDIGRVYDVAINREDGALIAATSEGLWQGHRQGTNWIWEQTKLSADSRLLERLPGDGQTWAVVTYDRVQHQSTLWLVSANDIQFAASWEGEPLRLTLDPRFTQFGAPGAPLAFVLLMDGDVVKIDAGGQTFRIAGISHPLFGKSYDIAVVPRPDSKGIWLLLGHRKGLMRYKSKP